MAKIRYIKLHNGGGFVTQMRINYTYSENGNEIHGTYTKSGYKDITLGKSDTIDLKDIPKISEGSTVNLTAIVVWGKDKTAKQFHTYDPNSTKTASYVITGTTLSNHLGEEEVS